jgi:cystathionine beta-lyase
MADFDQIIDRKATASVKFDARKAVFGREDVTPLWVADMDFATPDCVTKALIERANHPIFGYTLHPESMYSAMQTWFQQRHRWAIERKHIIMCPGVVPSMHAAIMALTEQGDKVIVQPPVYPPFFTAVTETKRELVLNPLVLKDNRYQLDIDHLEQCAAEGAKMLLLCSPHNPVGRVWQQDELEQILAIARRYDLIIISDEIHADLIFPQYKHIPLATLANDVTIITAVSPSKTFNIPGLGLSSLVVEQAEHRKAINSVFEQWHMSACNPFSIAGFEAAYLGGEQWLDELMSYLQQTKTKVIEFFQQSLPQIKVVESEGTYLLWLDCRELNMNDKELKHFFVNQAGLGLNPGISFGESGSGFMRLNIAAPKSIIFDSLNAIKLALNV